MFVIRNKTTGLYWSSGRWKETPRIYYKVGPAKSQISAMISNGKTHNIIRDLQEVELVELEFIEKVKTDAYDAISPTIRGRILRKFTPEELVNLKNNVLNRT